MMRQAISTSRLTVPSIGNCTTDQMIAMTSSVWRVCTRLEMKPTTIAEIANRKKNDEPIRPNCSGSSFELLHDRLGGEADDDLVGEVDQHEEEEQGGHAPCALEGTVLHGHVGVTPNSPVRTELSHIRRELPMARQGTDGAAILAATKGSETNDTAYQGGSQRAVPRLGAALAAAGSVRAQSFPSGRVTLVVPFPPGASTDITMRVMADKLSQMWGQPVLVDNKGGGNGIIAAEAVKNAKPDGYTLLATSSMTHAGNPVLYDKLPYDPIKDFEPITRMSLVPMACW